MVIEQGFSLTEQGFLVIEKGFSLAEKGFLVVEKGFSLSDQPFSLAKQGFSVSEQGFSPGEKGFCLTERGFSLIEKGFSVTEKGCSLTEKGFGKGLKRQKPSKMAVFTGFRPWRTMGKARTGGRTASGAGDFNEIVCVRRQSLHGTGSIEMAILIERTCRVKWFLHLA